MKLNRHLIIDAEILEKTFNEIMVCKTCNGLVSILENRNCQDPELVLRCNNSRSTSETNYHSAHKNKSRK